MPNLYSSSSVKRHFHRLWRPPVVAAAAFWLLACGPEPSGGIDEAPIDEVSAEIAGFAPRFPMDMVPVTLKNVNSDKCIDVPGAGTGGDTNLQQFACHGGKNQDWFLTLVETGSDAGYVLRAGHAGRSNMGVANNNFADGTSIEIDSPPKLGQVFLLNLQADGSYTIVSKTSNKCVIVADSSMDDQAPITQFSCNGSANQKWWITPATADRQYSANLIAQHSEKCLDIAGASTASGAAVQQYDCLKQGSQRWRLGSSTVSGGSTYHQLIAEHSGLCMDVAGASAADNATIQQYPCHTGDNQKWRAIERPDGYISLENLLSHKCLDIGGSSTANDVVLQQYTCNSQANQRFWYGRVDTRHIQVVNVADSGGVGAVDQSNTAISEQVARVNSIYGRYGIRLLYDPAFDRVDITNNALFNLNTGNLGTYQCWSNTPPELISSWECANAVMNEWPDKLVVYLRPGGGNGFSFGDIPWIAISTMGGSTSFQCTNVPDLSFLAHEFGHFMGLEHTFAMSGDDLLADTRPDPQTDSCLSPHSPTGTSGNSLVDTNNVMSYYFNDMHVITPMQAYEVRANAYARGY